MRNQLKNLLGLRREQFVLERVQPIAVRAASTKYSMLAKCALLYSQVSVVTHMTPFAADFVA